MLKLFADKQTGQKLYAPDCRGKKLKQRALDKSMTMFINVRIDDIKHSRYHRCSKPVQNI